jgi:hypothetical protein
MARCAVINSENKVINIIVAEISDVPPEGCSLVETPFNLFVDMGFTWNGTNFIDLNGNIVVPIEIPVDETEQI